MISDFPTPYLTHVDIVEAGLLSIDSDVLSAASTVESARFMNNRITHIDADAFRFVSVIFALVSGYINFYFPTLHISEFTFLPRSSPST